MFRPLASTLIILVLMIFPAIPSSAAPSCPCCAKYADLGLGEIPRRDMEILFDFEHWINKLGICDEIDDETMNFLNKTGISSLERTKLRAYQHGDQVIFETAYELPFKRTTILGRFLQAEPVAESKLLGRLDNSKTLMSFYCSGKAGILDAVGDILADRNVGRWIFEGDEEQMHEATFGFEYVKFLIKEMALNRIADESMVVVMPNKKVGGGMMMGGSPAMVSVIIPSADGRGVGGLFADMLISMMSEGDDGLFDEGIELERTKIRGNQVYYINPGYVKVGMMDVDGYLIISDFDGLERTLDIFNTGYASFDAPDPSNFYCYFNYKMYMKHIVEPFMGMIHSAPQFGEMMLGVSADDPEFAKLHDHLSDLLEGMRAIENLGWADCRLKFTGNGFEITQRVDAEIAELSLDMVDRMDEIIAAFEGMSGKFHNFD